VFFYRYIDSTEFAFTNGKQFYFYDKYAIF